MTYKMDDHAIKGKNVLSRLRRDAFVQRPLLLPRGAMPLHAMVSGAGHERQMLPATGGRSSYDWHGLRRGSAQFVLFQYTFAGGGLLRYGHAECAVRPGQAMILHFPHDNRYRLGSRTQRAAAKLSTDHWHFFYLCLHGSEVVRAWRTAVNYLGPVIQLSHDDAMLVDAARLCRDVIKGRLVSACMASAGAYRLAMHLLQRATPDRADQDGRQRAPSISRAKRFACEHLHEPIGVDDLASAAGLSRYHFSRRFRESEGLAPGQFLLRQRLQAAAQLLQGGDEPVKSIAYRCGFSDPNYFSKAFHKSFGMAPGELRRSGIY